MVACGGPLTNVAAALRQARQIASRMSLAWIGGSAAGVPKCNRDTDAAAARWVRDVPGLARRQFPLETYRRCAVSVAELEEMLGTCGPLGAWLWQRFVTLLLHRGSRSTRCGRWGTAAC